jgi:hypothetical protein
MQENSSFATIKISLAFLAPKASSQIREALMSLRPYYLCCKSLSGGRFLREGNAVAYRTHPVVQSVGRPKTPSAP